MDGYIGEVRMFAGNFAPRNWAFCHGQRLPIASNSALFSILGTTYGGDGRTDFFLPDLRGRAPAGAGQGPGLSDLELGELSGAELVWLTEAQLPAHNHGTTVEANASTAPGTQDDPTGAYWADPSNNVRVYRDAAATPPAPDTTLAADAVTVAVENTGDGAPHDNRSPVLGINFIICLSGIYPSR